VNIRYQIAGKTVLMKQKGAATIAMAIILLILISVAVFTVNGSIVRETKVINSGMRSQHAFEAAEAGLAAAADYFKDDWDRDNDENIDAVYDTDGDGIGDTNSAVVGTGRVEITTEDVSSGILKMIRVTSQGFSDDSTATRTVSQIVTKPDPTPNLPDNPLTARISIDVDGSATVRNPEGNTNIWSGGEADIFSNNSVATQIADPQDPDYPNCMETPLTCDTIPSSNQLSAGSDILAKDARLLNSSEDDLFLYYFGLPKSVYRDYAVTLDTTGATANSDTQYATEQIIWIDGDVNLENTTTIGCSVNVTAGSPCPDSPLRTSILIIDGNATISGATIFGMVYVTGNAYIADSTDIHGALVVGNNLIVQETSTTGTSGSLDLVYNSDVLRSARRSGNMLPIAGSWKDFK